MKTQLITNYQEWNDAEKFALLDIIEINTDNNEVITSLAVEFGDGYTSLHKVYTQPEYRGQGYASRLIEYCLENNLNEIEVYLKCNLKRANWYEKFGFKFSHNSEDHEGFIWMKREVNG